jgi:hypothetical protein
MQRRTPTLLFLLLLIALFNLSTSAVIANCYLYSNSNTTCSLCEAGYYSTSSGTVCTAHDCSAMAQCSLCDSTSTCLRCSFGYELNGGRTACTKVPCNDSQCNLCLNSGANQCYSCASSYYVDSNYSCLLCSDTVANCTVCSYSSQLTCSTCVSGYYTSSATSCATCGSGQADC